MDKFKRTTDSVTYQLPAINDNKLKRFNKVKDSVKTDLPTKLLLRIPATHGGYINGNMTFYTSEGMKDAVQNKRWTVPYKKYVTLDHEMKAESVIGRVLDAEYEEYDEIGLNDVYRITSDNKPTCHIWLNMEITDKDAIERFLDGRYSTVSIEGGNTAVECGICGANRLTTDCGHEKGKPYEVEPTSRVYNFIEPGTTMPCFTFNGEIDYDAVTVTPFPADRYAGNPSIEKVYDSIDYYAVTKDNKLINLKTKQFRDCKNKVSDILKSCVKDNKVKDSLTTVEEILNINASGGYLSQEQWKILDNALNDKLDEMGVSDTKVSVSAKQKLSTDSFCGPFNLCPITKCEHVTAMYKLFDKYEIPGKDSSIYNFVKRQADKLQCICNDEANIKDSLKGGESMTLEEMLAIQEVKDHIAAEIKHAIDTFDCPNCKEKDSKISELTEEIGRINNEQDSSKSTLEQAMSELLKTKKEVEAENDSIKKELVESKSATEALTDKVSDLSKQLNSMNIERCVDLEISKNIIKSTDRAEYIEKYSSRSKDSINDKLVDLLAIPAVKDSKEKPGKEKVDGEVKDSKPLIKSAEGAVEDPTADREIKDDFANVIDSRTSHYLKYSN